MGLEASFKNLIDRFDDLRTEGIEVKDDRLVIGGEASFRIDREDQILTLSAGGVFPVGSVPVPKDATDDELSLILFGWLAGQKR